MEIPHASYSAHSALLDSWLEAKTKLDRENKEFGGAFNPLNLIPLKEKTHSCLVGELLDPHGSHGQGDLFLNCFIRHLEVPVPEIGKWNISVEIGRVDIMLWREQPRSVILIENKSNDANDQPNQLYRYWHQQIYRRDRALDYTDPDVRRSFHVIYLSSNGSKEPAPHSLERPTGWELLNPAPMVPSSICKRLAFPELTELWQRETLKHIPTSNVRLINFIHYYNDHWNPMSNNNLIHQSVAIFDSVEKWTALWEIQARSNDIMNHWLAIGAKALRQDFAASPSSGWECDIWDKNVRDSQWHLTEFGAASIGIGFGWPHFEFHLHIGNVDKFDLETAIRLLDTPQFRPLAKVFGAHIEPARREGIWSLASDKTFNPYGDHSDTRPQTIAWRAAHDTSDFVKKMSMIIREITDNVDMTGLLRELNRQTSRQFAA